MGGDTLTAWGVLDRADVQTCLNNARHGQLKRLGGRLGCDNDTARTIAAELLLHFDEVPLSGRAPAETKSTDYSGDKPYVYNAQTGTYVFSLPGLSREVVLSRSRVDAMVSDYSSLTGKGASVNQLAREHDIPRPAVVGILRALGVTHDSLPFTDERMDEVGEDELAEEVARKRKLDVYRRLERDKWSDTEKDARRWRNARETLAQPVLSWLKDNAPSYAPPPLRIHAAREPWGMVLGLTDEHWGVQADGYDRETHRARYISIIERLCAAVAHLGRPDFILIPLGSDGMHMDTWGRTTTRGTEVQLDGGVADVVQSWLAHKVEQIDLLRQLGPVRAWTVPGNHDRIVSLMLGQVIGAWYRDAPDVEVREHTGTIPAEVYGDTLLAVHHGDQHKVKDLAELIPKRYPREWGQTRWRYCWTGHFHTERDLPSKADVHILRWPNAVNADAWHTEQGWDGGRRHLIADVISPTRGRILRVDEPVL